jgi:adenosylmethionine-8-amino-7-oxononanoate aminotransferase
MGNALACSVANASLKIIQKNTWQTQVSQIERQLHVELAPCMDLEAVEDVRVMGAIGIVECKSAVNVAELQKSFVKQGVWIRPFGKLVYIMPPYIINPQQLSQLTKAIYDVLK